MERSEIRDSCFWLSPGLRHSRCEASAFLSTAAEGRLCHPGYGYAITTSGWP